MPTLLESIDAAFAETPYPGDENLASFRDTAETLRGKHWREMPIEEFYQGDVPIPSLTAQAFHFYLPALLKASLASDRPDCDVNGSLAFFLNPLEPLHSEGHFQDYRNVHSLLSAPQLECMQAVFKEWHVRGLIDETECQQLLEAYSKQGADPSKLRPYRAMFTGCLPLGWVMGYACVFSPLLGLAVGLMKAGCTGPLMEAATLGFATGIVTFFAACSIHARFQALFEQTEDPLRQTRLRRLCSAWWVVLFALSAVLVVFQTIWLVPHLGVR